MSLMFSRKQFFREALRKGFGALAKWSDGDHEGPGYIKGQRFSGPRYISADFSPDLLRLEAERLGINPKSCERENLLRTVYEAMEVRQSITDDKNDNIS